jgi:osomolarity two-component system, sensor histidine kinase SLN1
MIGLKMASDAKGLQVIADLDRNVDVVTRTAAFRVQGKTEEWIAGQLSREPDKEAFVMGDEMRLIQVRGEPVDSKL